MQRLTQTRACKRAAIAALVSTILCYPRFALWPERVLPLWYLEATVFCVTFILWAFVFAWHTDGTNQPVLTIHIQGSALAWATTGGVVTALLLHCLLDNQFRRTTPEDYPLTSIQWSAMTLFSLGFNQLFLLFAPFAWMMRLTNRIPLASAVTVLFGVVVLLLKTRLALSAPLLLAFVLVRVWLGLLCLACYLRGGVILSSWFGLIVQSRHLLHLTTA